MSSHSLPPADTVDALIRATVPLPSHTLTIRQMCDLEMMMRGALAPLTGFMSKAQVTAVLDNHDLDGKPWPFPITCDIDRSLAESLAIGERLVLRDKEGTPLATLTVSEKWSPDVAAERALLSDFARPNSADGFTQDTVRIAGPIEPIQLPKHYDFRPERDAQSAGGLAVFVNHILTRNDEDAIVRLARTQAVQPSLLLNAVPGSGSPAYPLRARLLRAAAKRMNEVDACVKLQPLDSRGGGSRGLLLQVIAAANQGFEHVAILSRTDSETRAWVTEKASAWGVVTHWLEESDQPHQEQRLLSVLSLDRAPDARLYGEEDLRLLRSTVSPRSRQGFTIFFTGLSGAGKSTIAKAVHGALLEYDRPVTLLDGDVVRLHLSKGLGFSKTDRDTNIRRIGYVASEITRAGGAVICAPIAPYRATRADVRHMVEAHGAFVEVHVATDLATCEKRDPKGLYVKARAGQIKEFTGIDDPYEAPETPELRLDTSQLSVEESLARVLGWLEEEGYLPR